MKEIVKKCEICGKDFIIQGFRQIRRKYCFECSPSTNNPTSNEKKDCRNERWKM